MTPATRTLRDRLEIAAETRKRGMLDARATLRIQRGAEHLHRLGPRAISEFLIELAEAHDLVPALLDAIARYARLDPAILNGVLQRYTSGRQFPPRLAVAEGGAHG
jgi:hypothetical protein